MFGKKRAIVHFSLIFLGDAFRGMAKLGSGVGRSPLNTIYYEIYWTIPWKYNMRYVLFFSGQQGSAAELRTSIGFTGFCKFCNN